MVDNALRDAHGDLQIEEKKEAVENRKKPTKKEIISGVYSGITVDDHVYRTAQVDLSLSPPHPNPIPNLKTNPNDR